MCKPHGGSRYHTADATARCCQRMMSCILFSDQAHPGDWAVPLAGLLPQHLGAKVVHCQALRCRCLTLSGANTSPSSAISASVNFTCRAATFSSKYLQGSSNHNKILSRIKAPPQLSRRRQYLHTTVTCGMEFRNYNTSFYGRQHRPQPQWRNTAPTYSFHPPHSGTRRLCCTEVRPWKEHGHGQTWHHCKLATLKLRQVPCVHDEQSPQLQHWDCHTSSMMRPEWCGIALQGSCPDWRWSRSTFHPHIPASCTAAGPYLMRLVPGMVNTSSP